MGAGTSIGCGLPDWDALLHGIANEAWKTQPNILEAALKKDRLAIARLLKKKLKNNFNGMVSSCLYSHPIKISNTLFAIAKSGITHVCCFNFDELLEEAFATECVDFNSISKGDKFNNNYYGTAIFHPHGYLEPGGNTELNKECELVFSEEDYSSLYSDPYSWSNIIQLSLLVNYTCLFVGMSLEDPNIRRLLDLTQSLGLRQKHYIIMQSPVSGMTDRAERSVAKQSRKLLESEFESLGLIPIWVGSYDDTFDIFKRIKVNRAKK